MITLRKKMNFHFIKTCYKTTMSDKEGKETKYLAINCTQQQLYFDELSKKEEENFSFHVMSFARCLSPQIIASSSNPCYSVVDSCE